MKKLISFVMALSVALCALPAISVSAAENTDVIKGVTYGFRLVGGADSSVAALQSISGNVKNIVLPDYVTAKDIKYKLTSIDIRALENNSGIETFKFNSFCSGVGDYAFSGCRNLKSVTFNTEVRSIGMYAFEGTALESVTLPITISSVGKSAFTGCNSLKSFTAAGLSSIGEYALYNCPALTKVTLNSGLSTIGDKAFGYTGIEKNKDLTFCVGRDSAAQKYAQDNGFNFKYNISTAIMGYLNDKKYTGSPIVQPVRIVDSGVVLKQGADYSLTFINNTNPGFAKAVVTGIGMYEGKLETTFFIKPIVPQAKRPKATVKKKKLTVKWKKLKDVSGYQIVYSPKKNFRGKKTVTAKKSVSSKRINRKLKPGKYYIKMRAYKTVSGRRTYGVYSKPIMKKVK